MTLFIQNYDIAVMLLNHNIAQARMHNKTHAKLYMCSIDVARRISCTLTARGIECRIKYQRDCLLCFRRVSATVCVWFSPRRR